MSLNFNIDPYYDDFDPSKNYYRILFKPGYSVQARELTQSQSILQDQVTKFADNIFAKNSPVTGGQLTTNFNCQYIRLNTTNAIGGTIDINQFKGLLISDSTNQIQAQVLAVASATGTGGVGDPPTLYVSYLSGNKFTDNMNIYATYNGVQIQAQVTNSTSLNTSTGYAALASISQGVFYISNKTVNSNGLTVNTGTFVQVNPQTIIVSKYTNNPTARIGLNIVESIADYTNDTSLLDPAISASNYQAPGADRYLIQLLLESRPINFGDDVSFIELARIDTGTVQKMVDGSVYGVIDDYFAKRDYETNGDYIVNDFKLTPKANTSNSSVYTLSVGKGIAYVRGYRIDNSSDINLTTNRARTNTAINNHTITLAYGNFLYANSIRGNTSSFFNFSQAQPIDIHCVPSDNISTASATTYSSTLVATGYLRNLIYNSNSSDTNPNTFIYKASLYDLQNQVPSGNAVSATINTITLPSTFSSIANAYGGVYITITSGPSAGDVRTITSYNGATRVANVNSNWTTTPNTSSFFALNFDTKDAESIVAVTKASYPATINATAAVDPLNKSPVTGLIQLQNPSIPELLFPVGNPYVSNVSSVYYQTQLVFTGQSFLGGTITINLNSLFNGAQFLSSGNLQLANLAKQYFTVVVTGGSAYPVGTVLPWSAATGRGASVSGVNNTTLTLTDSSATTFTATIIAQVAFPSSDIQTTIFKYKNLITANTFVVKNDGSFTYTSPTQVNTYTYVDNVALTSSGQVYIQNPGLVSPGSKQSLYLSDVKSVIKILDTLNSNVLVKPATANLSSYRDVTNNYYFDNGQRDSYYDHATITLKPGAPQATGHLLVFLSYYQHTGGDGYFDVNSYLSSTNPEQYQQIPQYQAKGGMLYSLRDVMDFRPARLNAQTLFTFRVSNGLTIPIDTSQMLSNYGYYLGRKDKLVLSKDRSFQILEGISSLTPIFPSEPDGSLVIANLIHNPYTGYIPTEAPAGVVPDLNITKVKHKRYTMQDIAVIENRVNQVEYYTSLNLLEQRTNTLQVTDAYGLNRFKNGIMVDDFSSYSTADTQNLDYNMTINRRLRQMTASQNVGNYPLKALVLAYNLGLPSTNVQATYNYAFNTDNYVNYFTLPYTTANLTSQKFASRTVNVNPYSFSIQEGVINLSPNMDNWVDTNYSPSLLITDPNLQVFRAGSSVNVLSVGDWQAISSTSYSTTTSSSTNTIGHGINPSPFGFVGFNAAGSTTSTYTTTNYKQNNVLGPYDNIGNTYSINKGYITDISVLPYIRPQQIVVRAKGLLFNSSVNTFFDSSNVKKYVRKTNIIELTNVTGSFKENEVIGYYNVSNSTFNPTGRIVGTYVYPNTSGKQVRLYVAADVGVSAYSNGTTLQNGFFDSNGSYQSNTAGGIISTTNHFGGQIVSVNSTTSIKLSGLATTSNIAGNTIYINAGTGIEQSSVISNYFTANQTAFLSSSITTSPGDIYSIGDFSTNEEGAFYAIFNLPAGKFNTGQKIFRVDNSVANNITSATTFAQATYYAEGLSTTSQQIDFGASPSGAKNTFTSTNYQESTTVTTNTITTYSPWDPLAQSFIIDKNNYPNGAFLNSIKLFFASVPPSTDNSPITLSIVGTLNGYPNGSTLDHSMVTLSPSQVKVASQPQYLDSTQYTTFTFSTPVYIQPGVLYAFIVKSNSNQYTLWSASNGDQALASSTSNITPFVSAGVINPNYIVPSSITKIGSAPYVGGLFLSQNSQTWTADQNQALMFVMDNCVFDITKNPNIQFVVPTKLPQRTLIDQSVNYFLNANSVSSNTSLVSNNNVLIDALNITTTDFVPTTGSISYTYNSTLSSSKTLTPSQSITPGKFGTSASDNIYLNDGNGERILLSNSSTSLSVYAQLSSQDPYVSPVISDAGLSAYTITWNINNCPVTNGMILVANTGTGYNANSVTVTISSPTGKNGTSAFAVANVANGNIQSIYITSGGSGYITTPTITIADPTTRAGNSNASIIVYGETSTSGGGALAKYVTKKVVLDAGFDSGDLNVYMTAYRPPNTDILVYYKILNRNDAQPFEQSSWQLMTKINDTDTSYSLSRGDLYEFSFAPGAYGSNFDQGYVSYTSATSGVVYNTFSQFAIKVVLTTLDNTSVPFLTDLRVIALPTTINTIA
jgi:hypothetical protein